MGVQHTPIKENETMKVSKDAFSGGVEIVELEGGVEVGSNRETRSKSKLSNNDELRVAEDNSVKEADKVVDERNLANKRGAKAKVRNHAGEKKINLEIGARVEF